MGQCAGATVCEFRRCLRIDSQAAAARAPCTRERRTAGSGVSASTWERAGEGAEFPGLALCLGWGRGTRAGWNHRCTFPPKTNRNECEEDRQWDCLKVAQTFCGPRRKHSRRSKNTAKGRVTGVSPSAFFKHPVLLKGVGPGEQSPCRPGKCEAQLPPGYPDVKVQGFCFLPLILLTLMLSFAPTKCSIPVALAP